MVENLKERISDSEIQSLAKKIRERFNPQQIILFGSYSYGIPTKASDIDLFVIMDTKLSVREQAFLIRRELKGTIPIDVIVRTPQQVEERINSGDFFVKRILREGIPL